MAIFTLVETCGACPEAYNVYRGTELVGNLRLRHGHFCANCQGRTVYTAEPEGDGIFTSEERDRYLTEACRAILLALGSPNEPLYTIGGRPSDD